MTELSQVQATETMVSHHCRECGEQIGARGFCAAHPTILSRVHPLRAAVQAAEKALVTAQEALDMIAEPADDCAEGWAVSKAEDRLREAQLALVGSDCPRQWEVREEGFFYQTVTATSPDEAIAIARENVDRSSYSSAAGTIWIDVRVDCEETGERASDTVTLDEGEPDCSDSEAHHWESPYALVGGLRENPGVHGHGGGVLIREVCLKCGCHRVTDTWAQNPETGEQGLRSVTYEEPFSAEEIAAALSDDA